MIVTIDGPAGAGKSTIAKALAQRLGFAFLDTGAMYRAVALAAQRHGISAADTPRLQSLLETLEVQVNGSRTLVDGEDVSEAIRTPEVTNAVRAFADNALVRTHLTRLQRIAAAGRDVVTEGRDQGTVVFPDAQCKFFLTADEAERARRRQREFARRGRAIPFEEVLAEQRVRDEHDSARSLAPLRPAPDAVVIDTSALDIAAAVAELERQVRAALSSPPSATENPSR